MTDWTDTGSRRPRGVLELLFALLVGFAVMSILTACSGTALSRQAMAANAVAVVADEGMAEGREAYRQAQRDAVAEHPDCGSDLAAALFEEATVDGSEPSFEDSPCTQAVASAAVAPVRRRWVPVGETHDAFRAAHDLWRDAILIAASERGAVPRTLIVRLVADVARAYGELAEALNAFGIRAPPLPGELAPWLDLLGGAR